MSTIKIFILPLVFILSGCFEEKSMKEHGMQISHSQFGYRGVVEKSLDLKFEKDFGSTSEITAVVSSGYGYPSELEYNWKLGPGVTLAAGELKGKISGLEKNKKMKLKIKVNGLDANQIRHVGFDIIGLNSTQRVYADGVVSSQVENSFEKIVQEVEQHKNEEK